MPTPRRLRRAPILLAALIVPLFSVQADLAQARSGSLVPTQSEVAALFPYLTGGQSTVFNSSSVSVPQEGCTQPTIVADAHRGQGGMYTMPDGSTPYDAGYVEPQPLVYRLANPRAAEKAFDAVLNYVRTCRGWHNDARAAIRVKRVADPGLGTRSLAWRVNVKSSDGHGSTSLTRQLRVVVLRSKDLVWASLYTKVGTPSSALAEQLAKLTMRSSS